MNPQRVISPYVWEYTPSHVSLTPLPPVHTDELGGACSLGRSISGGHTLSKQARENQKRKGAGGGGGRRSLSITCLKQILRWSRERGRATCAGPVHKGS